MKTFSANDCFCPVALLEEGGGVVTWLEALHERLKEVTPTPPLEILAAWQAEAEAAMAKFARPKGKFERDGGKELEITEQCLIILTCRDEKHQVELLERFPGEGLECKALVG
jgi:hypothetical protein